MTTTAETTHPARPMMSDRARHLRRQARGMHPMIASAYRRRASELELAEWVAHLSRPGPINPLWST
jgi:hypothetical protein